MTEITDLQLEKYTLINSPAYLRLRDLQLSHILELSNKTVEPLLIKGMLKLINDTDNWKNDYIKAKQKTER